MMNATEMKTYSKVRDARADKFIHSVPVPHLYKEASKILLRYEKKEGSLKKLVFENKRYKDFRRLYATVCKAVDNAEIIQDAFSRIRLFEQEPRFNPQMAQVLAGELLFANKVLSGECLPVMTILKYKEELQSAIATIGITKEKKEKENERNPRYVRVNTLLTSTEEVHSHLVKEGWKQITYDGFVTYMDFLNLVKASCLPVILADIPAEAEIIDACAAPGNKTSHLAARMGNRGKIYAVEKDNERFQTLTKLLHQRGVTNVEYLNVDFTRLKKEHYENVSHIILDPSCSTTGMNIHQDELTSKRLKKLSCFQASILNFALSFANVKSVIYSTCSIHEEENEEVVSEALEKFGDHFELENLGGKLNGWKHFGEKKYPFGYLCLKTNISLDKCHGFFVAKFVRKEYELEKDENWKNESKGQKGINNNIIQVEKGIDEQIDTMVGEDIGREYEGKAFETVQEKIKKRKKKKKERQLKASVLHNEPNISEMNAGGVKWAVETKEEIENQMKTLDYVEECSERVRSKKRKKTETGNEPEKPRNVSFEGPGGCDCGNGPTAEPKEENVKKKKKKKKRKLEADIL
ncbi:28S rRNA (cytosine-C(5))-methyltransferase-like isoform X2 [Oratosquilla oratoria]|uniref:28S rRNA (cytosine-C(5))-methyltransferase-like isoform X2 n=1 Tax=Oratosquilla oratoria TaxID=337810 RepID=UPI003F765347